VNPSFQTNNPWNEHYNAFTPGFLAGAAPPNAYIKRYLDTAEKLVRTFSDIALWEVWNEPNGFGNGSDPSTWSASESIIRDTKVRVHTFMFPQLYAFLLAKTAAIIRSAHRKSMFGGILSTADPEGNPPPTAFPNPYVDKAGGAYLQAVRELLPGASCPAT